MSKQVIDPALVAAQDVERAESEFFLVPVRSFIDEMSAAYLRAEARWQEAEAAFADAVPLTATGALKKLRALEAVLNAMSSRRDDIGVRHIRSLGIYLARIAETEAGEEFDFWGVSTGRCSRRRPATGRADAIVEAGRLRPWQAECRAGGRGGCARAGAGRRTRRSPGMHTPPRAPRTDAGTARSRLRAPPGDRRSACRAARR